MIILLAHSDQARQLQGRHELGEILAKKPPLSELKALEALNNAAKDWQSPDPRIETIWERAVSVRPQDEQLYVSWFHARLKERKWDSAQKVSFLHIKIRLISVLTHKFLMLAVGSYDVYEKIFGKPRSILLEHISLRTCCTGRELFRHGSKVTENSRLQVSVASCARR